MATPERFATSSSSVERLGDMIIQVECSSALRLFSYGRLLFRMHLFALLTSE
jgi:hypothetical protein